MTPILQSAPVDGRVEAVADGFVKGWAWAPPEPDSAVGVAVVIDGVVAASGPANLYAPGLTEIGVGDGNHSFAIALPEGLADGGNHRITVLAGKSDDVVPVVSDWEKSHDGVWADTEFTFVEPDENTPPADFGLADATSPSALHDPAMVALVGKRDWLFGLGAADIRRVAGQEEIATGAVEAWLAELRDSAIALRELGIRHLVAIVPSKLHVHHEVAPDRAARIATERPGPRLLSLAHESDHLVIIDLIEPLLSAKSQGDLFHRRAATWNARGAFFAHRSLLKHAGVRGLDPVSQSDNTFLASTRPPPGSLEDVPRVGLEQDELLKVDAEDADRPSDEIVPEANMAVLHARRMPAEAHLEIERLPAPRVYTRDDAPERPRVVLLGHPCIDELIPWIAEATSRLVVISTPTAPLEQIELEFPDLVLQVLDERYLDEEAPSPKPAPETLSESSSSPVDRPNAGPITDDIEGLDGSDSWDASV